MQVFGEENNRMAFLRLCIAGGGGMGSSISQKAAHMRTHHQHEHLSVSEVAAGSGRPDRVDERHLLLLG